MPSSGSRFFADLESFADHLTSKFRAPVPGDPEDQLRAPVESLLKAVGAELGQSVVPKDQSRLPDRTGIPDYAVVVNGMLAGYVELKAPGKGANPKKYSGHDHAQWERFRDLPNVLYLDGNEWALYRSGEKESSPVTMPGDVTEDGKAAVDRGTAADLLKLLATFFAWEPMVPSNAQQLAQVLAPLCRSLRDDVIEALEDTSSPLVRLASEWRELLFPEADDLQFADAYAQTVTYALLLARSGGATVLDIAAASKSLKAQNSLLARALQVLTDDPAEQEVSTSLRVLQRVVNAVDPAALTNGGRGRGDPWLYFYEDFLQEYDPKLRKDAGIYFTDVEVVHAQVRLVDELLREKLGLARGFADREVVTLDPAVGTGTYLLGVLEHTLDFVRKNEGEGQVGPSATALAATLHGFEIMVGPYSVAELRLTQQLKDYGASLPGDAPHIHLTNTLESPKTKVTAPSLFSQPLAEEHRRALEVKESERVLVCLGNPPYDRHAADDSSKGAWVRNGAEGEEGAILDDFSEPAKESGHGHHLKNLYNLYVYFWRWAIWKVFEHETATGPGVVSFISASSFLQGDAFVGMREHLRQVCDELWVIDLGGEGRGTRKTDNVFPSVRLPVAITIAVRTESSESGSPAQAHYASMKEGSRKEKLKKLDEIKRFTDLAWDDCLSGWQQPLLPEGSGDYFSWPRLTRLFPWYRSGVMAGRTWPIATSSDTLKRRWNTLLAESPGDRDGLFKNSPSGRKTHSAPPRLFPGAGKANPINSIGSGAPAPPIVRYGFRSFDRQWILRDSRLLDRPAGRLWEVNVEKQIYIVSLFDSPLDHGPGVLASAEIPDRHFFCGRGSKEITPFWRDPVNKTPNLLPGLLASLKDQYGHSVKPLDFLSYCYGLLNNPAYVKKFYEELGAPDPDQGTVPPRVPITKKADLFSQMASLGSELLWLHTFGQRLVPDRMTPGKVPTGKARCTEAIAEDPEEYPDSFEYNKDTYELGIGTGRIEPIEPDVWQFEVSGLQVISSWLNYRMGEPGGRKSSPLDDIVPERWTAEFTQELLEVIWILERTLDKHRKGESIIERVLEGPLFGSGELPDVPEEAKRPPGPPVDPSSSGQLGL